MDSSANPLSPQIKISEGLLILLLALVNFTHIMDLVIMMPMNPILQSELSINSRQFGYLVSSYAVCAGITALIGMFLLNKFDRRQTILALYAGFTLATIACAAASTYQELLIARSFAGAFGGLLGALVLSVIGDVVPYERRGRAISKVMAAFAAASVLGIPVGLFCANEIGWNAPFWIISGLSVLILLTLIAKFPSIRVHMINDGVSVVQRVVSIFRISNARWALLFNFVLMISGMTIVPFIADYMVHNVRVSTADLQYIYLTGGSVSMYTSLRIGKWTDAVGKQKVFTIMAISSILPLLLITNLPAWPLPVVLCCTTLFFIGFGGRFVPATSMITSSVPLAMRGGFMSVNTAIQQLSTALAVAFTGFMLEKDATGVIGNFWLIGIFAVCATCICVLISFKVKPLS